MKTAPKEKPRIVPVSRVQCGLTKRELFAVMMAQSLRRGLPDETPGQIALWAIADAEALLRELSR
jgi:hypothetical protein